MSAAAPCIGYHTHTHTPTLIITASLLRKMRPIKLISLSCCHPCFLPRSLIFLSFIHFLALYLLLSVLRCTVHHLFLSFHPISLRLPSFTFHPPIPPSCLYILLPPCLFFHLCFTSFLQNDFPSYFPKFFHLFFQFRFLISSHLLPCLFLLFLNPSSPLVPSSSSLTSSSSHLFIILCSPLTIFSKLSLLLSLCFLTV